MGQNCSKGSKPLVTITGITGYVGAQVCLEFLKNGNFKVRGTVRSKSNSEKIDPLKEAFGVLFEQLEVVEADLLRPETIMEACEGSDYIVHVASPFPLEPPENEDDLIKPAVEGTTSVINAAIATGAKKVVVTSSVVSVGMGHPTDKAIFTEEEWSIPDNFKVPDFSAYAKSKTFAEKKAWEMVEGNSLELVSINPGLVVGPNIKNDSFSSGDLVGGILTGGFPAIPATFFPMVDVRDLAKAHLEAVLRDEANGKRFIIVSDGKWLVNVAAILKASNEFSNYSTHEKEDEKDKNRLKPFSYPMTFVNTRSKEILGIDYIALEKSLVDMGKSLIATGYIPSL